MRHSRAFWGFLAVGIILLISAPLLGTVVVQLKARPAAIGPEVAPIYPEEVLFSKSDAVAPAPSRRDTDLTMLEDSGAAIASASMKAAPRAVSSDLYSKLRSTESRFVGIGLEGSAKVNGKTFSWANVNLSNISYG
jgi:hypothetical protein